MKLWVDSNAVGNPGSTIKASVQERVLDIDRQVLSRGTRAVNAMRNTELRVLKGQRSGRTYKMPFSRSTYRASAPGEAPARRTGNLRMHWNGEVKKGAATGNGVEIIAQLESQEPYAGYLENGTGRMAPRPFVERIKNESMPEIRRIYGESYS